MSFKIPCGGFRLDENSFSLDKEGTLSVSGVSGGWDSVGKQRVSGDAVFTVGEWQYNYATLSGEHKIIPGAKYTSDIYGEKRSAIARIVMNNEPVLAIEFLGTLEDLSEDIIAITQDLSGSNTSLFRMLPPDVPNDPPVEIVLHYEGYDAVPVPVDYLPFAIIKTTENENRELVVNIDELKILVSSGKQCMLYTRNNEFIPRAYGLKFQACEVYNNALNVDTYIVDEETGVVEYTSQEFELTPTA